MHELIKKVKNFPDSSGVYLMKNLSGEIVYVGKATSLKERVRSYFSKRLDPKTSIQMREVVDIEIIESDSPLEAFLLESRLIKKFSPKYNIREKDDKSRIYVNITKEDFPRIELIRETDLGKKSPTLALYGPFLSTKAIGDILEMIRKIIPYRSCKKLPEKKCLYGRIGLCPSPCTAEISKEEYRRSIRRVRDFFEGKKKCVLSSLKIQMNKAAKEKNFEQAAKIRDRIYALEHIKQMFAISRDDEVTIFRRIEGYDISNISGAFATGSMVVFENGIAQKSEYRKFKIKWVKGSNDIAMLQEVLIRRFKHTDRQGGWDLPDLILIDGGRGQVNGALKIIKQIGLDIPVIGLAKGKDRSKDELITSTLLPRGELELFKKVRDEAHRFAKGYFEKLHRKSFIK